MLKLQREREMPGEAFIGQTRHENMGAFPAVIVKIGQIAPFGFALTASGCH